MISRSVAADQLFGCGVLFAGLGDAGVLPMAATVTHGDRAGMDPLRRDDGDAHRRDGFTATMLFQIVAFQVRRLFFQLGRVIGSQLDPVAVLKSALFRSLGVEPGGVGMNDLRQLFEIHRAAVVMDVPLEAGHDQFVVGQVLMFHGLKPRRHRIDVKVVAFVVFKVTRRSSETARRDRSTGLGIGARAGAPGDKPVPTNLKDAVERYLRARNLAAGIRDLYYTTLGKWTQWGAGVAVEELRRHNIRNYLDWVYEHAVAQEGGNPGRTANKARENLRAIMSWAWEQDVIETLPRFPKPRHQRDVAGRHYLPKAEINDVYFATHQMKRPRGWNNPVSLGRY